MKKVVNDIMEVPVGATFEYVYLADRRNTVRGPLVRVSPDNALYELSPAAAERAARYLGDNRITWFPGYGIQHLWEFTILELSEEIP